MSTLKKGQLFHNRYLLVKQLGEGASGEVWMARDTRADNLPVALKIFSTNAEMDSKGLQDFQREFTTVYNMKHSNLLPPTGYDICDGRPYLIMQYCENGSAAGMAGRMDEEDIITFLHDVSAGLEYLHDHNIIHQDIKPDNILVDDNCNYMVTDFGISVNSEGGVFSSNGMSGGTRAYMGPERFEGVTVNASDMWSLGATAVELLTGNPPYGEHGGLLQTEGEPLPQLPKLQPEVRDIIMSCLEADPDKRIKANEIRQKTELYRETGSWTRRSSKKTIAIVGTGVLCVLMCAGIFIWDYNRTKITYYKDYTERWGVPQGIGRLSSDEVAHRGTSYRFESSKRKLRRVTLVNSNGKPVMHTETEHLNSRNTDTRYFYTDDGKIDYTVVSDPYGKVLYKMDYDDNLKTATFRQNDEYGTEMNLYADTNNLQKTTNTDYDAKSRISRYLLTFDNDGLLTERRYAGLQNVPASDDNNIYGSRFKYDDKGRKIEEVYIGADGNPAPDKNGMAIRRYTYDGDDNWSSVSYLNAEGEASHDGSNVTHVTIAYDKYGNRASERYSTLDGTPTLRTPLNIAGYDYEYDENGNCIRDTYVGTDGKPAYSAEGVVSQVNTYNENGFVTEQAYFDDNGKPAIYSKDEMSYSIIKAKLTDSGLPVEISYFDENATPLALPNGVHKSVNVFDSIGNQLSLKTYGKEGEPILANGFFHEIRREYDDLNHTVKESYFDTSGQPATNDGIISSCLMEYNRQGALTRVEFKDTKGNPILGHGLFAGYTVEYDELGNETNRRFFDKQGNPAKTDGGAARYEYVYDPKTNFLTEQKLYDNTGKLIRDDRYKYDARGNQIESMSLVNGRLESGTGVVHSTFDAQNRVVEEWWTDLDGKRINRPGTEFSLLKNGYDAMGNREEVTYWKANGTPGVDEQLTHRRVQEFDAMNRVVKELQYGTDSKPLAGKNVNPEGTVKYDQWGNIIELACYDGYGKPRLGAQGYHVMKSEYDRRRNVTRRETLGVDGKPVGALEFGASRYENKYDDHGNQIEGRAFDGDKLVRIEISKYNSKNRVIELRVCDEKGNLSDKFIGFSRIATQYADDEVTPVKKSYYNQNGTMLAYQTWNSDKGEWNQSKLTAQINTPTQYANVQQNWQQNIQTFARACPYQADENVIIQSVSVGVRSVTIVIQLTQLSKYDFDVSTLPVDMLRRQMRQVLGLPSDVKLIIDLRDKANRQIATL